MLRAGKILPYVLLPLQKKNRLHCLLVANLGTRSTWGYKFEVTLPSRRDGYCTSKAMD